MPAWLSIVLAAFQTLSQVAPSVLAQLHGGAAKTADKIGSAWQVITAASQGLAENLTHGDVHPDLAAHAKAVEAAHNAPNPAAQPETSADETRKGHLPMGLRFLGLGDDAAIVLALNTLIRKVDHMSTQLDALTAEVAQAVSVEQSAITLIAGLRQQIIDAGTDPAKLQALTDSLASSDAALAAAVAAPPAP